MDRWVETGQIYRGENDRILPYNMKPSPHKDRSGSKQQYRADKVRVKRKAARRARAKNRKS